MKIRGLFILMLMLIPLTLPMPRWEDEEAPEPMGIPVSAYYREGTALCYQQYYLSGEAGAYGITDAAGEQVLPAEYEEIVPIPTGFLLKQGEWRMTDAVGRPRSPARWDSAEISRDERGMITGGLVKVGKQGHYGAVDMLGQQVIPMEYELLDLFTQEAGWDIVRVKREGRYGYIDRRGETVIPAEYDYAIMDTVEQEGEEVPGVYVLQGEAWGVITEDGGIRWDAEPTAAMALAAKM